jgi:hypothetical protein
MDKVQKTDPSNKAPSSKTFRDEIIYTFRKLHTDDHLKNTYTFNTWSLALKLVQSSVASCCLYYWISKTCNLNIS